LVLVLGALGCWRPKTIPERASEVETRRPLVVRSFAPTLTGIRTGRDVSVACTGDPERGGEGLLSVVYGAAGDPADRDVWSDTQVRDWSGGRAINVAIRADPPLRLSISFFDANGVGYTAWAETQGGAWQTIRIPLDSIRPNPYFQPPSAKLGTPLDLRDVPAIGFAPQRQGAGRYLVGAFVLER
jgi:hypothetical protein